MRTNLMRPTIRLAIVVGSLASLSACEWFTDFKRQPKIDPWERLDSAGVRGNPQTSVPITGSVVPGFAVSYANMPATIDSMSTLRNPTPPDSASLLNGRKYYTINCAVCHGMAGKGDGLGEHAKEDAPLQPILTQLEVARDKPDTEQNDRRHEDERAIGAGDRSESGAEHRVGAVAQLGLPRCSQHRRQRLVAQQQRQGEQDAVAVSSARREIRRPACGAGRSGRGCGRHRCKPTSFGGQKFCSLSAVAEPRGAN